jgi:hypothetical protein
MPSKKDDWPFLLVFENCEPEHRDHLDKWKLIYIKQHRWLLRLDITTLTSNR